VVETQEWDYIGTCGVGRGGGASRSTFTILCNHVMYYISESHSSFVLAIFNYFLILTSVFILINFGFNLRLKAKINKKIKK